MNTQDGSIYFGTGIDTSGFDEGIQHIAESVAQTCATCEEDSKRIKSMFTDMPKVNIDFLGDITSVEEMKEGIGQAFAEIARVVRENEDSVRGLTEIYNQLTAEANKYANVPGMGDKCRELREQKKVVKEVIGVHKQLIDEAKKEEAALEQSKGAMLKDAAAKESNTSATATLRQRIKELEAEAALMVDTAQREGIQLDQTQGRYREIIEELGRLKDIRGDISTAGNIFANDQSQCAGIISGLSGVSGAFTAAQGAVGLFAGENENLNRIMLKVQSLMSITMGLQQLQQTLNKDSAFTLVTLNSLKKLFGKHTKDSADALKDENSEIEDSTEGKKDDIAATEAHEAVEKKDTIAKQANNVETTKGTAAQTTNTTATEGATVAQNAHTGAIVAGTIASKAMAVAMRVLKVALISTGIGALVVLVGELVSWITELCSAEDEAVAHTKEVQSINQEAEKVYIQEKVALEDNIKACKEFHGTKEEEAKKVEELNSKYGESLGYYDSVEEWEGVLRDRGPAYCEMLRMKSVQQGLLNKYVEEYCKVLEVMHKAENGEFNDSWYEFWNWGGKGDEEKKAEAIAAQQKEADYWKAQMDKQRDELASYQKSHNLDVVHIDPKSKSISGKSGGGSTFDPKAAAAEQKKALEDFATEVKKYVTDTQNSISQAMIDGMEDGMYKELTAMRKNGEDRKNAWEQQLLQLAQIFRDSSKTAFIANYADKKKGEEAWANSDKGKRTLADWRDELVKNDKKDDGSDNKVKQNYEQGLIDIDESVKRGFAQIRDKYMNQLIDEIGTYDQKFDKLSLEWQKKIGFIGSTFPDFLPAAIDKMNEEFADLKTEDFKKSINWEVVFGNLGEQSLQSLQFSLDKVRTYFDRESRNMNVEQIKTFQEAINAMQDEIASRNPFTAMHKSFKDISAAKTELVSSLAAMKDAQDELNKAEDAYNAALKERNRIRAVYNNSNPTEATAQLIEAQEKVNEAEQNYQFALKERNRLQELVSNGELASDCEELTDAQDNLNTSDKARNEALEARAKIEETIPDKELINTTIALANAQGTLKSSETSLANAQKQNSQAEQNTLNARNKITKSYKNFATNLKATSDVVVDLGGKARNLASIFSDDVAASMDRALDFIDEVMEATHDVISAIGDLGKSVAKDTAQVADAAGQATQGTAEVTAKSISTVEKASIILTVISAALQIATAIAGLFNNDDSKQKEIDKLQRRIDQLQWELDNQETVHLQQNTIDAMTKLKECYADACVEILALHGITAKSSKWAQWFGQAAYQAEIYDATVQKIADHWANVSYTADKALGSKRFDDSRTQLNNLAEQQLLIQRQLNEESSKKKKDKDKMQDYQQKIAELAEEMATLINDMLEDIIGQSAEDLAKTLGDAFYDAVQQGEDAMEAWAKKTNELVSDILKRMMVQEFLEPKIGAIFDKYRSKWFKDGQFQGMDAVRNSADEFSNDINQAGEEFNAIWASFSDTFGKYFEDESSREASQKGIATASQDSVDENNARLTTIQAHTYTLVQSVAELNMTSNAMLKCLTGIEQYTSDTAEHVEEMRSDVRKMKNAVDDITTRGIKLKS